MLGVRRQDIAQPRRQQCAATQIDIGGLGVTGRAPVIARGSMRAFLARFTPLSLASAPHRRQAAVKWRPSARTTCGKANLAINGSGTGPSTQPDRLAARRATTEVEGRDIDVLLTQQTAKGADSRACPSYECKACGHRTRPPPDALNLDQTGLVTTDQRAADSDCGRRGQLKQSARCCSRSAGRCA